MTLIPISEIKRKPDWLKIRPPKGVTHLKIKDILRKNNLHTVCEESHCPNMSECWSGGTATFMVMGDTCTRGCRFCNVKTAMKPGALDPEEPAHLAASIAEMALDYVVITSVDRDDLPDQGSMHFAKCINEIRIRDPSLKIEVLIPDFQGNKEFLKNIVDAKPDVIAHNIETVERLTPTVRDRRAKYRQSINVLKHVKDLDPTIYTKSALMVGLGEKPQEIIQAMKDLRAEKVDFLTIGQYLQPANRHLTVQEYIHPDIFKTYEHKGKELGFRYVAAGPFVRSSYRAGELFIKSLLENARKSN